jgi:hypothetical protein
MAVTFSASGITYANGQVQKYAGIGSDSQYNRGGSLFSPKWGPVTSFVAGTFYYPTSLTHDVAIISVIFSHGPINDPDRPYPAQISLQFGRSDLGGFWSEGAYYEFNNTTAIGNPIITLTIVLPPWQYGFRAGGTQSSFVVGALQWATKSDFEG